MTRAATSPELALYRTPGKASVLHAAFLKMPAVYSARVNQTFTTSDQILTIIYDGGTGTLANVLPDMEVWIGSSAGAHDKGICRLRDKDSTHFYLSETSEIAFADNDYITILPHYGIWARPPRITTGGTVYMDETTYSDQHTNFDPMPNMGPHQVAELTGATVDVSFHSGASFCPGSSISSRSWSCATASASSDLTLADVTFQFNACGWHIVYLTVTAANGKSFFGVRYVYIWNAANPPFAAEISNPGRCDADNGGWEIELTCYGGVDLADVYERAMVILFSEDYYNGTKSAIGPVAGSENIWFIGWISKESNHLSSEQGSVTFTAHGAAYWMGLIPSWPDGVELSASADWTKIPGLTVDLGVYHHLRWRSTLTRVMDVTLSGDTRLSQEVSSSAQDLWSQLQEMTWAQIYARPGVNALNQLSIDVHPSLIPTGSRTYPTVMTITKADYGDELEFDREIVDAVGIVDMSGVAVSGPGVGSAYFALAPGHSLPRYGGWDIQTNLLLSSQSQVITLAGLYRSWQNNKYKSIPIVFDAAIRLIDCFPNQRCTINIAAEDNIRGFSYSGGLIPVSVQLVQDPETGYCHSEVTFEAQTSESQSRVGDTPGSGDPSQPPTPSLPPIVIPPVIIPGLPTPTADGPTTVILHDTTYGFIYTTDFNTASPHWLQMNGNLAVEPYVGAGYLYQLANWMFVTPSGAIYAGQSGNSPGAHANFGQFIARATVGGLWTIIDDYTSIHARYPGGAGNGIGRAGYNPLLPDTVAYTVGLDANGDFRIGTGGAFANGVHFSNLQFSNGYVSYGGGVWRITGHRNPDVANNSWRVSSNGASIVSQNTLSSSLNVANHLGVGSTPLAFSTTTGLVKYINNFIDVPTLLPVGLTTFNSLGCDPSGLLLMANLSGGTGKSKSSDGGSSWSTLSSLALGTSVYTYAGPGDDAASSRWIAAGSIIRYTNDFGTTWQNKEGNITSIAPFPAIDKVKVVGF